MDKGVLEGIAFSATDNVSCLFIAGLYKDRDAKKALQELLLSRLTFIKERIVFAPNHKLYVLISTAMLNRDASTEGIRKNLMEFFN